ncbi:hypothetical protein WR25_03764 [Diploscapter pachys]|uniref:Bicarbonate transporter-like transmembrane domain-containing protein n=1 Tax=Diploscapter pachys TaxID=2018661 RepID=A0A2A2LNJ0_9BILA|nr:hypothetical protein WR25_03764 [Diploscapter pachys]
MSQSTFTEPASQGSHVKVIVTQDGPNGTKTTRVKQMVTSSSPPMNSATNQGQMQNSTGQPERRRTSHTLLYVPEEDRIQGVEQCCCPLNCGTTMTFCQERKISLDIDEKRRTSNAYTGVAPCIAFRPILPRRASQPTLVMEGQTGSGKDSQPHSTTPSTGTPIGVADKQKMLTKRVSWLSMKSLQEVERYRRRASGGSPRGGSPSRTMSQIGSIPYLLEDREFDSDTPPLDTLSWSNAGNEYDNVTLMYAKHEKIPMKDFGSEIRATMDIDHLLNKAVLLLDLQETSLEEIFAKIIHEMDIQEPEFTSEQVRSVLFTQDAANQFHILSRTVQSICTTGTVGGTFDYDQTWICALSTLLSAAKELAVDQNQWRERKTSIHLSQAKEQIFGPNAWYPFRGLREEFSRRIKHYPSDFIDGIQGPKTIQKLLSTIVFLYFACLLPAIAFGVLNDDNTKGAINVRKVIMAQAVGGIFFSLFGGQPMIILLTTVPLAIYIKVIHKISEELGYDFLAMYACVGICCQLFLILYSATELCSLMKLATRSAEEMFSLFIAIAFTVESIRAISNNFKMYYNECDHIALVLQTATQALDHYKNGSDPVSIIGNISQALSIGGKQVLLEGTPHLQCRRDTSILYMLLMFGTLWLGLFLYNFRKTPYLTRSRREWLADYALPASVLIMSFLGSYAFSEIEKDRFKMRLEFPTVQIADIFNLPLVAYFVCLLLGFSLSFLFFIDQNITSAIVNNSQNKLKKGSSQSLDLFVVAILNVFLSMVGLPWMHGALPHSPLHLRALADVEERVSQGHVHEVIMNVRETRLASLIAHVLILLSTFYLLPYPLQLIPTSVLHGLFLYMALTSLSGNEMFERLLLLITEQSAYPPTHYIRKVPQRKVHLFTGCQLLQLIILCGFGFSPYPFIEMIFPVVCFLFLPIRHTLIPRIIDYKYLDALDGRH